MPHTLRSLELADEITAELAMIVGFDQDLAGEANRTGNRIRGLLTQFRPSLERSSDPAWTIPPSPGGRPAQGPRMAQRLVDAIFTALGEQTIVVPGTGTLDVIVPLLAKSLAAVHEQRRPFAAQIGLCWRLTFFPRS